MTPSVSYIKIGDKITSTWLSQKPDQMGFVIAAFSTLFLVIGSIFYWQDISMAREWMPVTNEAILKDQTWWRAWTALFAHADQKHLLSNSFLFFILGSFLTAYFGVFVFPLMAFFFGGITNLLIVSGMPEGVRLLGASGIVFWLGGVWLSLYFLLDQKHSYYQRALRTIGVALVLFFPAEAFDPQISYSSHFAGFAIGILFGLGYYWWHRKKFQKAIVSEPIYEEVYQPEEIMN